MIELSTSCGRGLAVAGEDQRKPSDELESDEVRLIEEAILRHKAALKLLAEH